jgi:hypothetical protein
MFTALAAMSDSQVFSPVADTLGKCHPAICLFHIRPGIG